MKLVNAGVAVRDGLLQQHAGRGVLEEAGDLRVAGDVENGLPWQAGFAGVAEPVVDLYQRVVDVGQEQCPGVGGCRRQEM